MEISDIRSKIDEWNTYLTNRQKKYIHYNSFKNFVYHYDHLPNDKLKNDVKEIISEYIDEVEENNFDFETKSGLDLANKYLNRISDIYVDFLNFSSKIKIQDVVIWGIMGDTLLYLIGILNRIYNVPIITVGIFIHFIIIKITKESKFKVWGIYY